MTVCLLASVNVVTVASGQRPVLQKLHRFLVLIATNEAFRRLLITEHAVPVTFENFECDGWVGCVPFVGPPSAPQDESYRRICAPNNHDELTLQILQHSANYMITKQINMSWDQVQDAPADEDTEMLDYKLGHNRGDERTFSRIDWRNIIARQMGQFRKDALNMFHGNGTAEWLDSLPKERRDQIINAVSKAAVTDAAISANHEQHKATDALRRERDGVAADKAEKDQEEKDT